MLKLYELQQELIDLELMMDQWAQENEGDITDFPLNEEMDKIIGDKRKKSINIAVYIKTLLANADIYKSEKKRLSEEESKLKAKAERLKNYLAFYVDEGEKIEDVRATISWRKSESVNVSNIETLPEKYIKIEKSPMLSELKKAVKSGEEISGVSLKTIQNIQIK